MAKKILISAGHSTVKPVDPGAVGNGFTEAYLALELRDLVSEKLHERGVRVIEDGADGVNLPLKKAIALAKTSDIAIEFHWNAGPPAATGIEVLSKPDKKPLAKKLAAAIHDATNLKLRGDAGWKSDSSGQHPRLAFCEAGGLIVEVCFISSKVDMAAYTSAKHRVAENIANVLAPAKTPPAYAGGSDIDTSSAAVPADEPTVSASADSSAQDPPNPLPEHEQPPINVEHPPPVETLVTRTEDGVTVEASKTNQQDVNVPAQVAQPEPYLGIGFWKVIKRDFTAATGGNLSLAGLSEYAQQASGWPPWIVGIISKIAVGALIATFGYLVFRVIHYAIDTWKKNQKVKVEVSAATDVNRKDVNWI
jgi:N-acetylmuramoyl-L-alanine amidase